jgi:hypothetical protein
MTQFSVVILNTLLSIFSFLQIDNFNMVFVSICMVIIKLVYEYSLLKSKHSSIWTKMYCLCIFFCSWIDKLCVQITQSPIYDLVNSIFFSTLSWEGTNLCKEKNHSDTTNKFSETDINKMFEFLIGNIFAMFGGQPAYLLLQTLLADLAIY